MPITKNKKPTKVKKIVAKKKSAEHPNPEIIKKGSFLYQLTELIVNQVLREEEMEKKKKPHNKDLKR